MAGVPLSSVYYSVSGTAISYANDPEHIRQLGMPWVRQELGPVLHFLVTEMQMKRISPVCNRIANQLHCFTHVAHKNVILPFDIRNEV